MDALRNCIRGLFPAHRSVVHGTGQRLMISAVPFYGLFLVTAVLGIFLSLLWDGGVRGLYRDDYGLKQLALDLATGAWKPRIVEPYFRPLAHTLAANLAVAIPEAETPVRALWALVHCANAALVGLLVHRCVPSVPAVIMSVWLFLVPVPAYESLLWHTVAATSALGATWSLLAIHALFTVLRSETRRVAAAVAGMLCLVAGLASYEQSVVAIALIPVLGLVVRSEEGNPGRRRVWLRTSFLTVIGLTLAWLYWLLIFSKSWMVDFRGVWAVSVADILRDRIPAICRSIMAQTLGPWGLGGMWREAFVLGVGEMTRDPLRVSTLAMLVSALVGVVVVSRRAIVEQRARPFDTRSLLNLFLLGLLLLALPFGPGVFVRNQIVESRMMYFPWIGFTLAATALLVYVVRGLTRRAWWPGRMMLLMVAVVYLSGVITLRGFAHAYRLRWEHDQRQVAALLEAVPRLPQGSPVMLLPLRLDERFLRSSSAVDGGGLNTKLYGVFEVSWSAESAARMAYRYGAVEALPSRGQGHDPHFTKIDVAPNGHVDHITVNGRPVATDQLLAFTYENDRVVLVSPLVLVDDTGAEVSVALPLVERVRTARTAVREMRVRLESSDAASQQ